MLTEGEGELDGDGRFAFDVPADLSEVPLPQVYTVDVEVTDISNQVVAGRNSPVVHKSDLYLGLRGVTGADTLVGATEHAIVSTKPLLVRPVLPLLLLLGDTAQLESVVNNGSQRDLGVNVTLAVVGLVTEGPGRQNLRVAAGGKAKVVWQVEVDSSALLPG